MPPTSISISTCQHLLQHWNTAKIQSITTPQTGTINTLRILTTDTGTFVLRMYKHQRHNRLDREHRVVLWVHEQGIPAVVPLRTTEGATFIEHEGHFVTLLPHIADSQIPRQALQPTHIEAMACFLARLHNALERCPLSDIPEVQFEIDRTAILSGINRFETIVRSIDAPQPTDHHALQRLKTRRAWLQDRATEDVSSLHSLPFQIVHGDYQEANIFFRDNTVSAIIDWDKIYRAPDVWEIIRTFDLMLGFQDEACISFLKAYRKERPLSVDHLDIAAHCYGLMRAYDLWLFEEIYDNGNDRVRQFVKPGDFVPIEDRWKDLSARLSAI